MVNRAGRVPAPAQGFIPMTKNAAIGFAAAAALAAILFFGHVRKDEPTPVPVPPPAPTVVKPPIKAPVTKPVPKPGAKPVVYHRVEQGGKQGPEQACTSVKPFAEGKSPADIAALAKQYGVSVAEVQRWFVCVQ